ncbi:MAG: aspartate carbamoyltransferase regulatory subunit [Prolixibacteraceae bacterium]|nr:aspartate carbamoyltransferase regulatory subunit [Prolixibacteraceae bacterium]
MNDSEKNLKKLKVSALKNGTVIDHIPPQNLFKVISILGLDKIREDMITFGMNLDSKAMGSKALIKISNKYFEDDDINRIALIAPNAKLNIIKDYKVVEKKEVQVPDEVIGIVKCFNPKCITNHEDISTSFKVINKDPLELKCKYCEKITNKDQMFLK